MAFGGVGIMAILGEITGIEYKINRDGDEKKMLLQAILEDVEDPQTIEYIQRGGEQTPPVNGSRVVVLEIEDAYKIGIAFDDDTPPDETLVPGDKKFYSLLLTPGATEDDPDTVTIQSIITLKKSGEITIQAADGNEPVKQLALIKLTNTGAIEINSTDTAGVSKGTLKIQNDGQIEINGTGDFAVRFNKLEEMVNDLETKLDAHIHPDPVSGNTGQPTVPFALDISAAKIDSIEVPS
jgi:hypothetical protein